MKLAYNNQLHLFPLTIHLFKIEEFFQKELIDFTYKLQETQDSRQRSNRNGWQSYNNLQDVEAHFTEEEDLECILHLLDIIHLGITSLEKEWDFSQYEMTLKPKISALWLNINPYGSRNEWHCHGNTGYSGCFYIKKIRGIHDGEMLISDGHIEFEDTRKEAVCWEVPGLPRDNFTPDNIELYDSKTIPTETGDLLIFPSYANHKVNVNEISDTRITASFNFNWHPA